MENHWMVGGAAANWWIHCAVLAFEIIMRSGQLSTRYDISQMSFQYSFPKTLRSVVLVVNSYIIGFHGHYGLMEAKKVLWIGKERYIFSCLASDYGLLVDQSLRRPCLGFD